MQIIVRSAYSLGLDETKIASLISGMDVAMELIKIFEANYPEAMGYTFVINSKPFF